MDLEEVGARLSIMNLYAQYSHAVDSRNGPLFADCFTEDGYTDLSSFPAVAALKDAGIPWLGADGTIRGRENLALAVSGEWPGGFALHHVCANYFIKSLQKERAKAAAYFVVFAQDNGQVEHYGVYEDELQRSPDGAWRISSRIDRCMYEKKRH
jgi:hypothetical protein